MVDDVIEEVVGYDALDLVRSIKSKKNISEFKIAEQLRLPINQTRNVLYRLYHANLVTFTRKKDKKKGWYIYYWTFNAKHVKHLVGKLKVQKLNRLRERIKRENEGQFFVCGNACIRLDFEQAADFEFKCPECGQLMEQEDNKKQIQLLEKEIKLLEKEVKKK